MWNLVKTVAYLGALSAALVAVLSWMLPGLWPLFAVLALAGSLGAYACSDRVVLRLQGARPLDAGGNAALHAANEHLSARAGIPAPRLYLIDADYANAFATGRGPGHAAIAVTRGLLEQLTPREVRGVLAHEIAHVQQRDVLPATIAAMLAALAGGVPRVGGIAARRDTRDETRRDTRTGRGLARLLLAPVGAALVHLAVSRAREYAADDVAARLTGDPAGLASALERLQTVASHLPAPVMPAAASLYVVKPLAAGGTVTALYSTHPPMAERIRRLRLLRWQLLTLAA